MPRSGNVEKYYSEKEGKIPTKESHNGDKHATITKLVIFIVNIVRTKLFLCYRMSLFDFVDF